MKKTLIAILFLCLPISAHALNADSKSPIIITSNTLKINYFINIAEYLDKVSITQDNLDINCHKMVIYYNSDKGDMLFSQVTNNSNNPLSKKPSIKKIDFFKDVEINKDSKVARGDTATFDPQKNLIILSGNVSLKENAYYIEGEKAIYNTKTSVFKIIGSKNKQKRKVQILLNNNTKNNLKKIIYGN